MTTRATTLYTLHVPNELLLEIAIERLEIPLEGSGVRNRRGYLSFRAVDDDEARSVAAKIAATPSYVVSAGLGVDYREL